MNKPTSALTKAQRELAIERSLDTVRQVALAMKTTDDLGPVVEATRAALSDLGIRPYRTTIALMDEKTDALVHWNATQGRKFVTRSGPLSAMRKAGVQSFAPRPGRRRWMVTKLNRRQYASQIKKYRALETEGPQRMSAKEYVEMEVKRAPSPLYEYRFFFSGGDVHLGMDRELDKAEIAIARRVTETFDFAYKRFLDLQEKERRAQEAEVEAALERIRSQALAMETTADLPSVSAALFRELAKLDYDLWNNSIAVVDQDNDRTHQWTSVPDDLDQEIIQLMGNVYDESPWVVREDYPLSAVHKVNAFCKKAFRASGKAGEFFHVSGQFTKVEMIAWFDRLVELDLYHRKLGELGKRAVPDPLYQSFIQYQHGYLFFFLLTPLTDAQVEEAKRFANVFAFAYDRFLDLQDKERRTREAEVEAALERVRSQALAMETSADIPAVSAAVFRELRALKFSAMGTLIGIPDAERNLTTQWVALADEVEGWDVVYRGDVIVALEHFDLEKLYSAHPSNRRLQASPSGQPIYLPHKFSRPELQKVLKRYVELGQWSPEKAKASLEMISEEIEFNVVQHKHGYLAFMIESLEESEIEEVKRFADTFAFAYDRFLDLQSKEQRAREAEIEAAIERVRARALGMQESKEVLGVATIMRNEFVDLGYELDRVIIVTDRDEEKGTALLWRALPLTPRDTEFGEPFTIQIGQGPRQKHSRVRTKAGEEAWVNQLDPKEVRELARQDLMSEGYSKAEIQKRVVAIPDPYYTNGVDFGLGMITFGAGFEFSDEDLAIAGRFADVFSIAYKRFKELEAKETQNRELTIQNALERVRAQAQGMQESNEVAGVVTTLCDEFAGLGYDVRTLSISVWDEERKVIEAWNVEEGVDGSDRFSRAPALFRPSRSNDHRSRRETGAARRRGEPHYVFELKTSAERKAFARRLGRMRGFTGKELERFARTTVPGRSEGPLVVHRIFHTHGWVGIWTGDRLSDDDLAVARQFVEVFDYTYGRFRELEEKEAQNRELMIQNALERVRAQAQGMQESIELGDVAKAIYDEFEGLGYELTRANIVIIRPSDGDSQPHGWTFPDTYNLDKGKQTALRPMRLPMSAAEAQKRIDDAVRRGDSYFVRKFEGKELIEWRRQMAENLGLKGRARTSFLQRKPLKEFRHSILHTNGVIGFVLAERLADEDLLVAKRFTDVFDYAYDRFQELKEKEDQNRELTIQNALERVRAQAQGMQESNEIAGVVTMMHDEFVGIGYPVDDMTIMVTSLAKPVGGELWGTLQPGRTAAERFSRSPVQFTPKKGRRPDPTRKGMLAAWEAGEPHNVFELVGKRRIESFLRHAIPDGVDPDASLKAHPMLKHDRRVCHRVFHTHGWVAFWTEERMSDEDLAVAKRFTDAFDYAYGRFRELEEKEAQNRELTIQNALERVRAQAQGMQESNEIAGVVTTLFEEFTELGYDLVYSMIALVDEENGTMRWVRQRQDPEDVESSSAPLRYQTIQHLMDGTLQARSQGKDHFTKELKTRRQVEDWRVDRRVRAYGETRKAAREFVRSTNPAHLRDYLAIHRVFHTHGLVVFGTESHWSEEDLLVAKRFTDVFDYAYGRFQELKEKEDQNRELTIQNALERVRAQAQGMQESIELGNVAKAIYEEFEGLGYELTRANIVVVRPSDGDSQPHGWAFPDQLNLDKGKQTALRPMRLPLSVEEARKRIADVVKRAEPYFVRKFEGKELTEWRRQMADNLGLKGRARTSYLQRKPLREYRHNILHTNGVIGFVVAERLSDEDLLVAKRFTDVFDYAYDRFQELKEKEDQNRELTIQNAVERIRAKAQGMQTSDEIAGVAKAIYDEFLGLGHDLLRAMVVVREEGSDSRLWGFSPRIQRVVTDEEANARPPMRWPVDPEQAKRRSAEAGGKGYYITRVEGAALRRNRERGGAQLGLEGKTLEAYINGDPSVEIRHSILHAHGLINFVTEEELPEEDLLVAKRFTDVFDYAYDRFQELKEKEDQNRELTIQNAIERVRAQAQGMQESDEIAGVAKAVYDECQGLGYPLLRATVVILDEESSTAHLWGFSPRIQGMLGVSDEEVNSRPPTLWPINLEQVQRRREAVARGDSYYITRVEGAEHQQNRERSGALLGLEGKALEAFINDDPSVEIRHSILHAHGVINFVTEKELPEEDLLVAKRFTDVFDYAYDRFQELKEKEDQNRELIIQNAIERVRAQAQGMQESNEVAGVVTMMHDEFVGLGYDLHNLAITIQGEEVSEGWNVRESKAGADRFSRSPNRHRRPARADKWRRETDEARDRGEPYYVFELRGTKEYEVFVRRLGRGQGLSGQELEQFVKTRLSAQSEELTVCHRVFHAHGMVAFWMHTRMSDEDLAVAKRFTDVFDYTYGRFRELEEKEAQNRELTIQNAIERVRAQAQGMQESHELGEVVWAIYNSAREMDLPVHRTVIGILVGDAGAWAAGSVYPAGTNSWRPGDRPSGHHRIKERWRKAIESGSEWDIDATHNRAQVRRNLREGLKHGGAASDEITLLLRNLPKEIVIHRCVFEKGVVGYHASRQLGEDELAVLKRFTDVFAFAYDRFLELKQKEDQNRELTIQNAIERVRAQAQGMQESQEITSVAQIIYDEFTNLGHELWSANIQVIDRQNDAFHPWQVGNPDYNAARERLLRKFPHGVETRLSVWQKRGALPMTKSWTGADGPVTIRELSGDALKEHRRKQSEVMELNSDQRKARDAFYAGEPDSLVFHGIPYSRGNLVLASEERLTDQAIETAKRLVAVFSFAYDRFLELKQKEDQNRELTIQNAIERVRARALGMQESVEIGVVCDIIYKESQDLGFDLEWLTISARDRSDRSWSWSSGEGHTFRQEGQIIRSRSKLWRR